MTRLDNFSNNARVLKFGPRNYQLYWIYLGASGGKEVPKGWTEPLLIWIDLRFGWPTMSKIPVKNTRRLRFRHQCTWVLFETIGGMKVCVWQGVWTYVCMNERVCVRCQFVQAHISWVALASRDTAKVNL